MGPLKLTDFCLFLHHRSYTISRGPLIPPTAFTNCHSWSLNRLPPDGRASTVTMQPLQFASSKSIWYVGTMISIDKNGALKRKDLWCHSWIGRATVPLANMLCLRKGRKVTVFTVLELNCGKRACYVKEKKVGFHFCYYRHRFAECLIKSRMTLELHLFDIKFA